MSAPPAETDFSGNLIQDYVHFAGRRMVRVYNHNPHFYFGDQIGSWRVITYSNGQNCYDADFLARPEKMSRRELRDSLALLVTP